MNSSLPSSGTDVLGDPTPLSFDQAFTESAAPFVRKPKFLPNGRRPTLQKVFAVRICRESEFDSPVVENLPGHQRDELLNVLPHRFAVLARQMQE
jgi:hypothetical protein